MKKRNILTLSIIGAMLLLNGFTNNAEAASVSKKNVETEKKVMIEAKKAIMLVGGTLKKTMKSKMKESGPSGAANFCSISATDLAKEVSKTLPKGVKVKRITSKPRNTNNMATKEQLLVLNELEEKMKQGNAPKMLVKKISDNHYQVYKPIKMDEKCIICHGSEKTRNSKAYEIIASKYKNDKAVNYKVNDFRGAFLVDIIK